jgi:hypothetical protein
VPATTAGKFCLARYTKFWYILSVLNIPKFGISGKEKSPVRVETAERGYKPDLCAHMRSFATPGHTFRTYFSAILWPEVQRSGPEDSPSSPIAVSGSPTTSASLSIEDDKESAKCVPG